MLPARCPVSRTPVRPAPAQQAAGRRGGRVGPRAEPPAAQDGGVSQEEIRRRMEMLENDPEFAAKMQEELDELQNDPNMKEQMEASQQAMASPEMQAAVEKLRADPEVAEIFEEIQKGGMPTLLKMMQRPEIAQKIGEKMGKLNLPMPSSAPGPQQPGSQIAAPDVTDLLSAARMGDEEATEDFIAVGKDVNQQDAEGRTPAHFAAAHDATQVLRLLLDADADLTLTDSKGNTSLHYAAGYGRVDIVDMLLEAGADVSAQNATGKRPLEVAKLNPDNPVLEVEEIVEKLSA